MTPTLAPGVSHGKLPCMRDFFNAERPLSRSAPHSQPPLASRGRRQLQTACATARPEATEASRPHGSPADPASALGHWPRRAPSVRDTGFHEDTCAWFLCPRRIQPATARPIRCSSMWHARLGLPARRAPASHHPIRPAGELPALQPVAASAPPDFTLGRLGVYYRCHPHCHRWLCHALRAFWCSTAGAAFL